MRLHKLLYVVGILIWMIVPSQVTADSLDIPNNFRNNKLNVNFDAVKLAVDDNDARITTLEDAVDDNDERITALEEGTEGEESSDPVFQGFSLNTYRGGEGVFTFIAACDATFTGSKMCTSVEIANSTHNSSAENVSGEAWILPVLVGNGTVSGEMVDAGSGLAYEPYQYLTCRGWSSTGASEYGLFVDSTGAFDNVNCATSQPVACCK